MVRPTRRTRTPPRTPEHPVRAHAILRPTPVQRLSVLTLAVAAIAVPVGADGQRVGVSDFDWLAGEWAGPGPDGTTAEIDYMPPSGAVLPALFRLLQGDRVLLLEAITLVEEDDGLFMYVRHFDPTLVPMEKEQAIRLRLVERDGETFFFENTEPGRNPVRSVLTRTPHGFVSRSFLARPDGSTDTLEVAYHRR